MAMHEIHSLYFTSDSMKPLKDKPLGFGPGPGSRGSRVTEFSVTLSALTCAVRGHAI